MTIETENTALDLKLGDDEKAVTINLEETPPDSSNRPTALQSPTVVAESPQKRKKTDELEDYSENVKKRIDKLTSRLRETERREQAAMEYAQGVQRQAQELETRLLYTDNGRLSEAKTRSETQTIALKQIIRKAREEGDIDTETEAHGRLTALMFEQRSMTEQAQALQQAHQMQQARQTQQAQQAQRSPAKPDPRAEEWAGKNLWFGQDTVMTHAAWGIHRQLIENEGFDAASDEYYDELDRRVADTFPNRARRETTQTVETRVQRPVQAVAPATRSSGVNTARRSVRLSPSQVAIAKKLGVPLEEYAKYVKD